jgi:hypothetical protein
MGSIYFSFRNIHQSSKKRLKMGNTEIFIIGLLIFATYMFFLLRMVSKQHEIQKNEENTILRTESYEKKNQKD